MAAIQGMRGTGSWGADPRPKSYRETILYLYPHGKSVLVPMTSKLREESVDDPELIRGLTW